MPKQLKFKCYNLTSGEPIAAFASEKDKELFDAALRCRYVVYGLILLSKEPEIERFISKWKHKGGD